MRKSFTSVFRYYRKGVLPSLLNYLTFFMLRWRQKTMFWYAHVYFYLLYVLLVITQLFKTILKKENITVWITLISRKKVTSSFMYIHQRIYYLYATFIFVEYNLNRSTVKRLYQWKIQDLWSDHLPRLLKGRTLTATLILSVAILFDCVAVRLVFVSSPPQLTVLSTSFYDTHNKRSLLLIAGTATCFLRKEILFHRSAGYYILE